MFQELFINAFKDDCNAVICRSMGDLSSVKHYGSDAMSPYLFDANNKAIGLSEAYIKTVNSNGKINITCSFKRANSAPKLTNSSNYIEINESQSMLYILSAFGAGKIIINNLNLLFNKT